VPTSTDTVTEGSAETPADTQPEAAPAVSDDLLVEVDGKLVPNYDATIHPFGEGDVVSGKVVRIDKDEILVDIGYKSEGVIPSNELSIRKSVDPSDEVQLGEEVDALVLTKEDQEGRLILSKKRARFEKAWRRIEAAAESGEPVEGTVIEVVKGGLILDLGVRGFLPASLVDIRRVQNLDEFMGQKLECKVIELNRSRNNVVLSRRAVLEEERKEVREQILGRLQPGQVVEGKISNIVDFGAFVDLEGIDGLIHISELSWSHVNHPSEVVSIGDTVRVKVLDIDRDRQRISLGLKQTQEDPWQRVLNEYKVDDVVEGKVTKIVAFGAFVQILPGVEGLVHISELAQHHVESPAEVVRPGDELKVKILEVDDSRRRLSLSVKRVEGQELPLREPEEGVISATDGEAPPEAEAAGQDAAEAPEAAPEGETPEAEAPEAEAPEAPETPEAEAPEAEAPEEEAPEAEVETPEAPPEEAPPEEAPEEETPDELPEEAPPEEQPVPDEGS
jgi:small subunit ribosomal protein S1